MSSAEASEPKVVCVAKPSQQQRDRVMQQHGSRGHGDSRSLSFQRLGDRLVTLVKVPFVSAAEVTPVRLTTAGCGRVLNDTVSAAGVCRIVAEKLSDVLHQCRLAISENRRGGEDRSGFGDRIQCRCPTAAS